jgi:hypothetical protein
MRKTKRSTADAAREAGLAIARCRPGYEGFMADVMRREPRPAVFSDGKLLLSTPEVIREYAAWVYAEGPPAA